MGLGFGVGPAKRAWKLLESACSQFPDLLCMRYGYAQLSVSVGPCNQTCHMGGCQNYGPFLDPYYNTAPNI